MPLLSFLRRASKIRPNLPPAGTRADPRIVVAAFARTLESHDPGASRVVRAEGDLPFSKATIDWALKVALSETTDQGDVETLGRAFMLLGRYQDIERAIQVGSDPDSLAVREMEERLASWRRERAASVRQN
ncbi:MAG: hypothetical protein O9325_18745 [Roseomonas sp.]|nr:hypothetical protein [Roseomonas sp.]